MKLIRLLMVAGSVALAFSAFQAKAQPFPLLPFALPYQFEPLNFSLIVSTQALDGSQVSSGVFVSTIKSEKITSQGLLKYLATACNTNWPKGAKLALNINDMDIYVVDKTGASPVFNLSEGIDDEANTNRVYLSFEAHNSIIEGKQDSGGYVTGKATSFFEVFFYLYVEQNGVAETSLDFYGLDADVFKLTSANAATETDNATVTGDGWIQQSQAEVNGQVSGSGSWKVASGQEEFGGFEDLYPGGASPILLP